MKYECDGIIFITDEDEMPGRGMIFSTEDQNQLYRFFRDENGEIIGEKVFSDLEVELIEKDKKRREDDPSLCGRGPYYYWGFLAGEQREEILRKARSSSLR